MASYQPVDANQHDVQAIIARRFLPVFWHGVFDIPF
jgi:hypothetical protein